MKTDQPKPSALPAAPSALPAAPHGKDAARVPRPAPAGNATGLLLITIVVVAAGVLAFPSFIILVCGIPPALAAALIDNRPGRHASYCVMAANMAGMVPVLTALWFGGNSIGLAMMLMSDVYVWLSIYGAAATGWLLIWLLTYIVEFMLTFMTGVRVRKLYAIQTGMVAEWGPEITGARGDD